jgi:23S rRNA (cytidine1920-2'-O)/16S rRNA (cytidine1409-2'-O)-methyltransferase
MPLLYRQKVLLPVVKDWLCASAAQDVTDSLIALVKPQFEAGRGQVGRGKGVIRDPAIHRQVLLDVLGFACQEGFALRGLIRSPLTGPKGNVEFLAWLEYPGDQSVPIEELVDSVLLVAG